MGTIRRHVVEHPRTNETTQVLQLLSTFEKRKACLQRSIFWLAPLQQLCLAAPVVRSTLTSWHRGPRPPVAFTSKLLVLMRVVFPKAPQPDSATVTSVVEPPPPSLDFFLTMGGLVDLTLKVKLTPRPKEEEAARKLSEVLEPTLQLVARLCKSLAESARSIFLVEVVPWLALRVLTSSAPSSMELLLQVTPTPGMASQEWSLRPPTQSGVQPTKAPLPFLQVQAVSRVSMTSSQDSETESSCRTLSAMLWLLSLEAVQL